MQTVFCHNNYYYYVRTNYIAPFHDIHIESIPDVKRGKHTT